MKSKKKAKAKKWVDKPAKKPKKIKLPGVEVPTALEPRKRQLNER